MALQQADDPEDRDRTLAPGLRAELFGAQLGNGESKRRMPREENRLEWLQ